MGKLINYNIITELTAATSAEQIRNLLYTHNRILTRQNVHAQIC